ncbi:MAG: hypothetical protein ACOYMY_07325 [Prochlorococcaceae cyanobacterium]|jgi:uncharacterized protein (DUF58 family)
MPSAEPGPEPRRFPPVRRTDALQFTLRNVYVFPSRFGWCWLLVCLLLLVLAFNSGAAAPLLLAGLCLGLFLLALLLTPLNLRGLQLRAGEPVPGFADGLLHYPLLSRSHRRHGAVSLRTLREPFPAQPRRVDIVPGEGRLSLVWRPQGRGLRHPGPIVVESWAPLGLFRCWGVWRPPVEQLVYPAPRPGPVRLWCPPRADRDEGGDWWDLTAHRPEEGLARVAWGVLARGGGWQRRRFAGEGRGVQWLLPDPALPREQALEALTAAVLHADRTGVAYGLRLDGVDEPPGSGRLHRDRCLAALALAP